MNMETINFSTNWNNKLTNRAFTTIRIHNDRKYYVGREYQITLNNKPLGVAVLKKKHTIKVNQLTDCMCFLDTGYSVPETINIISKMYPNLDLSNTWFDFCLLVFKSKKDIEKEKREREKQKGVYVPYFD
jgi:hypothetical protein